MKSSEKIQVHKAFTPTVPATMNYVARGEVNDLLVDALRTPGKQVIVYGESGCGKSTLIRKKLEELYPAHITTHCSRSSTFENVILDAFDQLDRYFVESELSSSDSSLTGSLTAQFLSIKSSIQARAVDKHDISSRRTLPPLN